MKDNLDYFFHYTTAHTHPKHKALIAMYGFEGYGRFWLLNELIGSASGAQLDLRKKVYFNQTAGDLGMKPDEFQEFIDFLSDDDECGLIQNTDGVITTKRTQETFEKVEKEREKNRARKSKKPTSEKNDFPPGKTENPPENEDFQPEKTTDKTRQDKSRLDKTRQDKSRGESPPGAGESAAAGIFKIMLKTGISVTPEETENIRQRLEELELPVDFIPWIHAEASSSREIKNPGGFVRTVLKSPGKYTDWVIRFQKHQAQGPPRAAPPSECQRCGSTELRTIENECGCSACGAFHIYDENGNVWELDEFADVEEV